MAGAIFAAALARIAQASAHHRELMAQSGKELPQSAEERDPVPVATASD